MKDFGALKVQFHSLKLDRGSHCGHGDTSRCPFTRGLAGSRSRSECVLEGPEYDSIRIETCCPNTIINKIKFCCV